MLTRYYTAPALSQRIHCVTPSLLDIRSAVLNAGYQVSSSHADKDALKTNATPNEMWDVMRGWVKLHPSKKCPPGSAAARLLAVEPKKPQSFELHPDANPASRVAGINRFQQNPLPNWGPKARARKRKPAPGEVGESEEAGQPVEVTPSTASSTAKKTKS